MASSAPKPGPTASIDRSTRLYRNKEYPKEVWFFLAAFIATISVAQLCSRLYARRRASSTVPTDPELAPRKLSSIRQLPSALINVYRIVAFRWTVSVGGAYTLNIAEVFLTVAYIVALFTWAFINTTPQATHKSLDIMFWSNRSGALVASQLPLIAVLGTKNNIIAFLTGVSYEKLNYLHRMTARVVLVLLWVHGASRISRGIPEAAWDEAYLRCGLLALTAFTLLCIVSLRPVRAGAYELFFYAHFLLVFIFLISAYYHTAENKPFNHYVWPAFAIWGLDRFIRVVRLVVFNNSYFGFKSGSGTLDATATLLSPDVVRLSLRRPDVFRWHAGQTAYLILPSVSAFPFEAHPFTIASVHSTHGGVTDNDSEKPVEEGNELVFFINARGGFTKRLSQVASEHGTLKVFVDGPYGVHHDLSRFDTSVLIAGGSGISYTLPILLNIIQQVRTGASNCRRVLFIWSIRNKSHIGWISDTLTKALSVSPPTLTIEIQIFVTGVPFGVAKWENNSTVGSELKGAIDDSKEVVADTEKEVGEFESTPSLLATSAVTVNSGRPNLRAILLQQVHDSEEGGKISVDVCGSHSIAQSVRTALRLPPSVLRRGISVALY